jgi:hypothetical protein
VSAPAIQCVPRLRRAGGSRNGLQINWNTFWAGLAGITTLAAVTLLAGIAFPTGLALLALYRLSALAGNRRIEAVLAFRPTQSLHTLSATLVLTPLASPCGPGTWEGAPSGPGRAITPQIAAKRWATKYGSPRYRFSSSLSDPFIRLFPVA